MIKHYSPFGNQARTVIIWDSEKCDINDEINIADYLGPAQVQIEAIYKPREPKRRVAETKPKLKKK